MSEIIPLCMFNRYFFRTQKRIVAGPAEAYIVMGEHWFSLSLHPERIITGIPFVPFKSTFIVPRAWKKNKSF